MGGFDAQARTDLVCALINSLSGLAFGTAAVGLNVGLGPLYSCQYNLTDVDSSADVWQLAGLIASINVGAMVGSIAGGSLTKTLGVRLSMIIAAIGCLFTVPSMFIPWYSLAMIIRIVTGLGVGVAGSTSVAFVSVKSSAKRRGALGALFQIFITVGILISALTVYFALGDYKDESTAIYCSHHDDDDVQTRLAWTLTPAAVSAFLLLCASFLPGFTLEQPEGAQAAGEGNQSEDKKLPGTTSSGSPNMDVEGGAPTSDVVEQGTWGDVFKEHRPLACAVVGALGLQLCGINAVMFYCPVFLKAGGVSQVVLGNVIIMAWNCVTTFLGPPLLERLGRRLLFITTMFITAAMMVVLTIVDNLSGDSAGTAMSVITFIILALYIGAFECGPGCAFWVIASEVFSAKSTTKGFALLNMLQWTLTLIVTLAFPPLNSAIGEFSFLIFGVCGCSVAVFYLFFFPETKGKTKEELQEMFSEKKWVVLGRKQHSAGANDRETTTPGA